MTTYGYCDHVRILSARVENSGELGWVWLQFGRGEVGWERRRRRNRGRECRQIGGYIMVFLMEYRWLTSVDDFIGDSVTSLYGYLSLNPSVISSVKSSDVTTPLHISRQTVYPVGDTVGIYRRNIFVGIYRPFRRQIEAVDIHR